MTQAGGKRGRRRAGRGHSTSAPAASVPPAVQDPSDAAGMAPGAAEGAGDDAPARFAAAIGVRFDDLGLLRLALTHRSVLHDWQAAGYVGPEIQSNERLEFVGDALLGAIVAEHLYERYPDADEGVLTARRVALVRAETLVRWAREIDLGAYLYLGHGERVTEGARDRMLAGAFEALVGAIARDRGMREAKRFVLRFLVREVETVAAQEADVANPKGHLQELLQDRYRLGPTYQTRLTEGPAHERVFTVEVSFRDEVLGVGVGGSKRDAEQAAARVALALLAERGPNRGAARQAEPDEVAQDATGDSHSSARSGELEGTAPDPVERAPAPGTAVEGHREGLGRAPEEARAAVQHGGTAREPGVRW